MCQAGLNTADFKVALHQLTEHAKLVGKSAEQWANLAGASHEDELSGQLKEAAAKVAEAAAAFEHALEHLRGGGHSHTHDHGHGHGHVHITQV